MKNELLQYELIETSKLIPYVNNSRTHTDEQISKVMASIKEFGFLNPILISDDNVITAGHCRLIAAQRLGLEKVPCIRENYLTPAQRKAYVIADNRLALDSGWDEEMLKVELETLEGEAFDLSLTGFDEKELSDLFKEDQEVEDDDFDEDEALEGEPFVKLGDVWKLGRHRLVCGDSTKADNVAILMDGKKANLCITDPPYNCAYEGGTGMKIMNDHWDDSKKFYQFLFDAFKNIYDNLTDGAAFYCFHSDAEKCNFYNATVDAGFHYSTTCVWVKNALVIGRMDFQMRHEPVLYAFKDTAKHKFYGDRKQTTVWEFDKPTKSKLHPTTKSLPLIAYPMKLSSMENGIVLDLFGGSGSTLMAAEQLNRIAFLMELDPKYASAIVKRYVAAHGGDTSEVTVIRDGKEIPCNAVYVPSDDDLSFKDGSVNDMQKGKKNSINTDNSAANDLI